MFFVYLLQSIKFQNQVYVGYTEDIEQRLYVHNTGGSPHTAKYKPWKIQAYFAFVDKAIALDFEKYLKSHSGKAFSSKRLGLYKNISDISKK